MFYPVNGRLIQLLLIWTLLRYFLGFLGDSDGKESACSVGDLGWENPGEGHGNPLQYSCLENSMDRGAWQAIVHGTTKS